MREWLGGFGKKIGVCSVYVANYGECKKLQILYSLCPSTIQTASTQIIVIYCFPFSTSNLPYIHAIEVTVSESFQKENLRYQKGETGYQPKYLIQRRIWGFRRYNGSDVFIGFTEVYDFPVVDQLCRVSGGEFGGVGFDMVVSWGAYLLSRDILTVSFAPRDTHEGQVQFSLERGVPALIGILASIRLPYPSRAFDMGHCSRCLIPWVQHDGIYLTEVDRVLRPGGYWILSRPLINWERHWKGWERIKESLNDQQDAIENVDKSLCWKKLVHETRYMFDPTTRSRQHKRSCWWRVIKVAKETNFNSPRISTESLKGITSEIFKENTELWKKRVSHYKTLDPQLATAIDSASYNNPSFSTD
ncbi:probable methyltransferase PMT15 [Vicia villosa]|uniref:probable methyltransferase PMT15 n=1 Tax=Vicia villosa TaxID=3911 RepID=UPI00273C3AF9|nr:probable methyltransferase PMT15 [Vicia villosa]